MCHGHNQRTFCKRNLFDNIIYFDKKYEGSSEADIEQRYKVLYDNQRYNSQKDIERWLGSEPSLKED